MSPRPKTAPDAAILEAAARLLARHGPARLRLEDVAREVGLSPATLLLRFKSKRRLLLAVAEHGISGMAESFRARRRTSESALHVVTDVSDCVREIAAEPQQLANLLAFLQLSLEDPEFRACAERHDATLERAPAALIDEARARGELIAAASAPLARAVIAMLRGSLLTWSAIGHHIAPEQWVKADLHTLLDPYRVDASAAGPRARASHPPPRSQPPAALRRRARRHPARS
jgi:AcrR family transcriptional regulator